jgi:hypothetical protein
VGHPQAFGILLEMKVVQRDDAVTLSSSVPSHHLPLVEQTMVSLLHLLLELRKLISSVK